MQTPSFGKCDGSVEVDARTVGNISPGPRRSLSIQEPSVPVASGNARVMSVGPTRTLTKQLIAGVGQTPGKGRYD
jgi:hypothetical protein